MPVVETGAEKYFGYLCVRQEAVKIILKTFPLLLYIHGNSCLKVLRFFFTIINEWVGDKETHML